MPGAAAIASSAVGGGFGRITEIIPSESGVPPGAPAGLAVIAAPTAGAAAGQNAWASAGPCVDVFVRTTEVDGRRVVSVDLHGDGLVKSAVPPHLAAELLARAAPADSTGSTGARSACVPTTVAQSLFDPLVNPTGFDAAARLARVGDRWVLASAQEAAPPASRPEPIVVAAATRTRGDSAPPQGKRREVSQAKQPRPSKPAETQNAQPSGDTRAEAPDPTPVQLAAAAPVAKASVPDATPTDRSLSGGGADREAQQAETPLSPVERILGTRIQKARALPQKFSLRPDSSA